MFRARHVLHGTLIVASLLMASCGSSGTENRAPEFVLGPATRLPFAEGASPLTLWFTLSDQATATIAASDGLEATLLGPPPNDPGSGRIWANEWSITLRAPYGVTGQRRIDIVARNASGESHRSIEVDVTAAGWSAQQTWTDGPEPREHAAVIYDEERKRVIVIGGSGYKPYGTPLNDVWAWSLTEKKWSKPAVRGDVPSAAGSRRVAVDGLRAYLFGGYGEGSAVNDELIRVHLGDPLEFTKLVHPGTVPARSLHAFVKARDGFVVFGGAAGRPLNDTWWLTIRDYAVTMTKLETPVAPTARYGFFYGADAERLVIWSGAQSFSTVKPAQDTWAFDFAAKEWSRIAIDDPNTPTGRRNGCFAYDQKMSHLFVFGGTADAMTTEPGFYVLDARPGKEAWTKIEREGEPALRSSGFGFWDPMARTANCGFGNTTMAVYADWTAFGPQP